MGRYRLNRVFVPEDLFLQMTQELALIGELLVHTIALATERNDLTVTPLDEIQLHYGHLYDLMQAVHYGNTEEEGPDGHGTRAS